jgi:UDP-2,3-diacylglucosamine pyrophosphatase LpxH
MTGSNRLTEIYQSSQTISFNDSSKIVLISDCHRGDGTWADTFSKNQSICFAALEHYYNNGYTYIEIGDGDELWENKRMPPIINMHKDIFLLLNCFYNEKRLYMIFGNHDIIKKNCQKRKQNIFRYFDVPQKKCINLFNQIQIHEGLVLKHEEDGKEIFLVHGHQVDFLNCDLWRLARFLVRHLWRPLEVFGVNDPTSAAKNNNKKDLVEEKLADWVSKEDCILIAGHTHRPVFPDTSESRYFNDGSCVHPNCVTAIELAEGKIVLVKWCIKAKPDGTLFTAREIIAGPEKISDYFSSPGKKPGNKQKHDCD